MDIGSFIRSERQRLGLTQEKFGLRIGTTGKSVSNIERGVGNPSRATLRKLADALGRTLDELDRMCGEKSAA
jgi:transcriptional regulator with XRE-family HTH domain